MTRSVVVVGGGIVGCATAYFCAREGMSVTLVERKTIGYGASGRNPGWLWLHCRTPGFALDISRAGRALYPELLRDLPGGFEFRPSGGLMYFTTPEQGAVFEAFVAARQADGLDMSLIDGAEVRRLVPPIREDVLGASYCTEDAQIVTSTVVDALVRGARGEGATIREGITVTGLVRDGDRVVGVETDTGRIAADAGRHRHGRLEHGAPRAIGDRGPDRRRAAPDRQHRPAAVLDRAARLWPERDQAIRPFPRPAGVGPDRLHHRGRGPRWPGVPAADRPALVG